MCGNLTTQIPGINDLRYRIENMIQITEAFIRKDSDPNFRDISGILTECEQTSHLIRSYLEYVCLEEKSVEKKQRQIMVASPIRISFDNRTLRVFTPLTFNRGIPDSFILAESVRKELQKYQKNNGLSLFWKLKPPLTVVLLRKALKYSSRLKDNDNMETGRIINVIFPELGLSDNCMLVPDIHSGFRIIDNPCEEGMEFIIFSQADGKLHFNELFAGLDCKALKGYR